MKRVLVTFLSLSLCSPNALLPQAKAVKPDCDSPVWRAEPECVDEDGRPKPQEILDPDTGLMVIERESDVIWDKFSRKKKIPFSQILKLTSSFDNTTEYAVFDRNYRFRYPYEVTVLTKWTSNYITGLWSVKTGCGYMSCSFGYEINGGYIKSPLEIKYLDKTYTLYGDDGKFILPQPLINRIKEKQSFKSLSIRVNNTVIPIGEGTVEKLSQLYGASIKTWKTPNVQIAIKNIKLKQNLKKISGNSLPSVVTIKASGGQGTGFFINDDGLIITNRHVVSGGSNKDLSVDTISGKIYRGKVIYISKEDDFALVQVSGKDLPPALPICYGSYPLAGENVFALGSPMGLSNTVTQGIISAVRRAGSDFQGVATSGATLLQTDASINPGNSGGPLLNENGEVIGINTFGYTSTEGINFAVSIIDVLQQLNVRRPIDNKFRKGNLTSCGNNIKR